MKILHFGSNYLPNKGGNVVRMTSMLENNKYKNVELFIMTLAKKDNFDDEKYYRTTGIRIIRIPDFEFVKRNLKDIIKKYQINIIVTHILPATMIACKYAPSYVKIYTEIHSIIDSGKIKNFIKTLLYRYWLNKRIEKFFVLSKGAAKYIQDYYKVNPNRIVFLPNGVNKVVGNYQSGNSKYFTFGYVGTFYIWQGIKELYQNIELILSISSNIRLYLVGGGEFENELKLLAKKYKERLIITGLIPKNEVKEHMKEIDVLLIPRPSTLETETAIPLKIFDGVQYGKPVIISNVFGLTEVFDQSQSFIYEPRDKNGLYKICNYVYKHPEKLKEIYESSVKRIQAWYSWDSIHEIQYNTFKEVKSD